jgi:hypothetical protein
MQLRKRLKATVTLLVLRTHPGVASGCSRPLRQNNGFAKPAPLKLTRKDWRSAPSLWAANKYERPAWRLCAAYEHVAVKVGQEVARAHSAPGGHLLRAAEGKPKVELRTTPGKGTGRGVEVETRGKRRLQG